MEGYGARLTLEQRERYCGPDGLGVKDREQFEIFINCKNLRNRHGRNTVEHSSNVKASPPNPCFGFSSVSFMVLNFEEHGRQIGCS